MDEIRMHGNGLFRFSLFFLIYVKEYPENLRRDI